MSIIKTKSRGINLADNFAFTGTVSGAGTEIEIDQWELPSAFDDGYTNIEVINTWQRASNATSAKIGTGLSMTGAGVFSFPRTGLWTINLETMYRSVGAWDKAFGITIHGSQDDFSSESTLGTAYTSLIYKSSTGSDPNHSTNQYVNGSCNVLFNCSNITTHKVRFKTNSIDTNGAPSSIQPQGSAGDIQTGVLFQRVGNAQ